MPTKQAVRSGSSEIYTSEQLRPLFDALQAAKAGDFSVRLPEKRDGILSEISRSFNEVISLNEGMAAEIVRVARTVGREGRMTERASLRGAQGSWDSSTQGINSLIEDLARPTTEVARVITAVAEGDLSQKMALEIEGTPIKGEFLRIGQTVNTMVDQLGSFAAEVTRVAREVGTEGILGGQAEVKGVSGTWKDLTDNVNLLAGNLTNQVRNIALVTTAVANGDLSQKITVDVKGEILELKNTINTMVDQLGSFAAEVTRVAREVGTEGKLGGQAEVKGVSGTWKDLTDNVNLLAGNLTNQVRNIALVTTAVANGDLSQKITVDARGEILELKDTINIMVDQLNSFAAEVTRVAREVGTEGILGGQAEVKGVSGTWKDLTDNVNLLAGNLTNQVRNIALVTTAVANGDLSQKITVDVRGEILELKNTINTMVDQLGSFAAEVTRVAREVGSEGKLGGQAQVSGVSGTWRDLTDNVNLMASNLTGQVRNIALVTTAVANGDLSQKITVDVKGEILELKNTINTMVDQLNSFAAEVTRVAREVGTEGKLGGQAQVSGVSGTWKDLTDNVNSMASNLTTQVRGIVKVVTAVANGDLSQALSVDAKGEVAALADTINGMIDTLSIFAEQVTTVAREVGTEGILGGQAKVPNVAGTWKDLTDNVNFMASNLTTQVRGIAKVVTAVADGDLKQKLVVDAKGEVAALADTINSMTDTLSIFAEQVTTVAREVGTEGILGGQAKVPNVAGTWKDLTENVNFMANSLTVQVRAISDVATAVTEGDLTRFITVEAQGEVSALKNKINQMIANLKETTRQNTEQDWLKTNLARFSGLMQGQKSLEAVARLIMSELTPLVSAHHGAFYISDTSGFEPVLSLLSSYAFKDRKNLGNRFALGESLVGQCALEKKSILLTNVPPNYIQINSGLGEAPPLNIIVLPVLFEGEIMAVIELASFQEFSQIHRTFLDQLMESVGVVLNMISANMRTEELLQQSQELTQELQSQSQELQSQQDQLKRTNIELGAQAKELEEKASLLAEQNKNVEMKNREVELARGALEEKAEQLALSSKYKSEFVANMSHELRTPLNSMLILAKLLSDNPDGNLNGKQVEFANTIYSSGEDLLNLINEILDLSKVEAGKMEIDITEVALLGLSEQVERTFAHVAQQKGLGFEVRVAPGLPRTITTDEQRLQQVLRNLLSNAFKFTEAGQITLTIGPADKDVILDDGELIPASRMVSFSVVDTGIGIAQNKQNLIFEAFQQADGSTNRKFGGTGLGLSISREITKLLGGRIRVESEVGKGSEFILYIPYRFQGGGDEPLNRSNGSNGQGAFPDPAPNHALVGALTSRSLRRTEIPDASDDREGIRLGDRVVLIAEDDPMFAGILLDIGRTQGFKGIIARSGETALELARTFKPDAITLDLRLSGMDGWTVLDKLKRDPGTRHIPVQVISVLDKERGATVGAISYIEKPVTTESLEGAFDHFKRFIGKGVKELLIVEDDQSQRDSIVQLLDNVDLAITAASSGTEAQKALKGKQFDCMVLDLGLPDMSGMDLLKKLRRQSAHKDLPVVVYTSKDLSIEEERQLKKLTASVITKGAKSSNRLLDETAIFLHRVTAKLSPMQRKAIESFYLQGARLSSDSRSAPKTSEADANEAASAKGQGKLDGTKVLIVDDDIRNIFALTGLLESEGAEVIYNESGRETLQTLKKNPGIDLVLMDIMMPEMDGLETTRAIRNEPEFKNLPIIALTAKALEDDKEKCFEAGVNDYIKKPVDNEHLLNILGSWTRAGTKT